MYMALYTNDLCLQTMKNPAFESLSRDFPRLKCCGFSNESVSRSVKNKCRKHEITQKTTQLEKKKLPKDIF